MFDQKFLEINLNLLKGVPYTIRGKRVQVQAYIRSWSGAGLFGFLES